MPRWLKATLLAVGVLTVASFIAQPAVTGRGAPAPARRPGGRRRTTA